MAGSRPAACSPSSRWKPMSSSCWPGSREDVPGLTGRERLNLWFLGDDGQRDLLQVLAERPVPGGGSGGGRAAGGGLAARARAVRGGAGPGRGAAAVDEPAAVHSPPRPPGRPRPG